MKKSWFIIILVAVIFVVGIKIINDEENINTGSNNINSVTETENTRTETIYEQNDDSYAIVEPEYTNSKSGYFITGELEHRRYSLALSDISLLNGFFMLDQSKQNLYAMTFSGACTGFYESKDLYRCEELPLGISRDKGESLVILGDEWSSRSDYEKENMIINVCDVMFLGYGNSSMRENGISVDEMISVNGVTITPKESSTTRDKNYELITQQLKGTDISCVYDFRMSNFVPVCKYLVSSKYNAAVTCQYSEGTQYKSITVNMKEPFIVFDQFDNAMTISLPVQTTQNGYFIIDISSLSSGIYAIKKSTYPSGISYFVVD